MTELVVVEYLAPVIEWHATGLLPMGRALAANPRCRLVRGRFLRHDSGRRTVRPGPPEASRRCDSRRYRSRTRPPLDPRSDSFYRPEGLRALGRHLMPGGIFDLWSNAGTDTRFLDRLGQAFAEAWAEPVTFDNPLTCRPFTQRVYLARRGAA